MDVGRLTCFRDDGCRDYGKRRKVNDEKYLTFFSMSRWSTTVPMENAMFEQFDADSGNKEENYF